MNSLLISCIVVMLGCTTVNGTIHIRITEDSLFSQCHTDYTDKENKITMEETSKFHKYV